MITLDKPSFIFTSEETQTNKKVSQLSINVEQYLAEKESKPQGYIMAKINCDFGPLQELTLNVEDTNFKGKDVLSELHKIYITELSALNKKITFTDTYNN